MKQLFLDIKTHLETAMPELKFIQMWNNQVKDEEGGKQYSFQYPAVLPEFLNDQPSNQLGNGVQVYDPLRIKFHLLHQQLDAADGTMEQNLDVLVLKQKLYKALQKFKPTGAGWFVRSGETMSYDHNDIYEFVQEYTTTYMDASLNEPVDGTTKSPVTPLEISLTVPGSGDTNEPYTIVP